MSTTIRSRHRIREIKKWSKNEVIKVLDYILQTGRFEKPTAQIYYNKLIAETNIIATWDMLRWKMRNLRVSFQKCNDWLKSNDAKVLEAEQGYNGIISRIQKMCPHYHNLRDIYAEKTEKAEEIPAETRNIFPTDEIEMKTEVCDDAPPPTVTTSMKYPVYDTAGASSILMCAMDDECSVRNRPNIKDTDHNVCSSCDHQEYSSCAFRELSKLQSQRKFYYDKKIQIEQNKLEKDFLIEERKIELEKAKLKLEEDKFRADIELRKAALEKEERIAKFEIEMKYKYKHENNKQLD